MEAGKLSELLKGGTSIKARIRTQKLLTPASVLGLLGNPLS